MGKRTAPTDGVQVVRKKLSDYRQIANNPTGHNARNVGTIVSSIQQVGAGRSGLASGAELLAGNATWEAMAEAGIEDVIEVTTDGHAWVVVNRPDLTEEQKRFAAHADQRSAMLADIDPEALQVDLDAGVDLSALYRDDELGELLGQAHDEAVAAVEDVEQAQEEEEPAGREREPIARADVPDALWPSDNEWGIPLLDIHYQADAVDFPVMRRSAGPISKMRGTCHMYTEDRKFMALWNDPSPLVNTKCVNVVEANFTCNIQRPMVEALWAIYKKRWLARYWQSKGFRVFVDLNVGPSFEQMNLLGVPAGWRAYATRGYVGQEVLIVHAWELGCQRAGSEDVLFWVYGGGKAIKELCASRGWLWVPEDADAAHGRYAVPWEKAAE